MLGFLVESSLNNNHLECSASVLLLQENPLHEYAMIFISGTCFTLHVSDPVVWQLEQPTQPLSVWMESCSLLAQVWCE